MNTNIRPTFRAWLFAHTGTVDHVGDLARDVARDVCWTGTSTRSFLAHLTGEHEPPYEVVIAADDAVDRYRDALAVQR